MTKIVKSKSKAIPSSRKKLAKKAVKAKRAAPKSAKRSKQRNSAETRGSKQHQPTVRLPLAESTRVADAEGVTRRFPRPFLSPFAMMDMWFRAVEPKRDSK
jgi:hypothetical protein